jgi:glycine betaine catabolism B
MIAHFTGRKQEDESIYTYYFKPEDGYRYIAGQFLEFTLDHKNADSRGIRRWFTLSSSPTEKLLSITLRQHASPSSFKKTLHELKPMTPVHFSEAMGDFVLPKSSSVPIVFIACGIGVTPYRSMVCWLNDTDTERKIELIQILRNETPLFADIFSRPFLQHTVYSRADSVTPSDIMQSIKNSNSSDKQIYISGPETVVEQYVSAYKKLGLPSNQLVTDYFHGYNNL